METQITYKGQWAEYVVAASDIGETLESVLLNRLHVSKRMIKRLIRQKGIRLNGKTTFLSRPVKQGDIVRVAVGQRSTKTQNTQLEHPIDILWEDEDLLVINKPTGVPVHPTNGFRGLTMVQLVSDYLYGDEKKGSVHPVHRLDRDTSGVLLLAKNSWIHSRLDEQLRTKEIRREYVALVEGVPKWTHTLVNAPIDTDPESTYKRIVSITGKEAATEFTCVATTGTMSVVAARLSTGRTHQIRVHLAHAGFPVIGDVLYNEQGAFQKTPLCLHAFRLEFQQPRTGQVIVCSAHVPDHMERLWKSSSGSAFPDIQ